MIVQFCSHQLQSTSPCSFLSWCGRCVVVGAIYLGVGWEEGGGVERRERGGEEEEGGGEGRGVGRSKRMEGRGEGGEEEEGGLQWNPT